MKTVMGAFVTSIVLIVLIPLSTYAYLEAYARVDGGLDLELAHDEAEEAAREHAFIALAPIEQERLALRCEKPVMTRLQPEVVAYGRIEEDPSRIFTVRAPIAGILHVSADYPWPNMGEVIEDAAIIGQIAPLFGAAERVDLSSRLAQARGAIEASSASLEASRAALKRSQILNAERKNVSDRALQEAEAKVRNDEAMRRAASEQVNLIEKALAGGPNAAATVPSPLVATQGGEVIDVLANPGESIAAGQAVLRVARYDQVIVRVNMLPGDFVDEDFSTARVSVLGLEDNILPAERIAFVPSKDQTGTRSLLLRIFPGALNLRPGQAVMALLPKRGGASDGVVIARSAVVRHEGQAWVYVQTSGNQFLRRPVILERPVENGWFTASTFGTSENDRLVVTGAQALLSEELKSWVEEEDH